MTAPQLDPNAGIPASHRRKDAPGKDGAPLAAGVAFVDPDGRVLFVRRAGDDHRGEWSIPAGSLEGEEDFPDAARREAGEETGTMPGTLRGVHRGVTDDGVDFATFASRVPSSFTPMLDREHDGHLWATLERAPEPLYPGLRRALETYFAEEAAEPEHARSGAAREIERELTATDSALVIAFDRESVRDFDKDGRLHVAATNISKANVCPYRGSEIPGWQGLGLAPDKVYRLYRDPDELARAAETFNRLPVLKKHVAVDADDHQPEEIVGTTGSDASFEFPYLRNSLALWAKGGIDLVESGRQRELSAGYHYRPDMTPGSADGIPYDGVMRDIVGNHVALVETGRAGPDVVVADSMENVKMPTRLAIAAAVLTARAVRPLLAMDQKVDFAPLFRDVTTKNLAKKRPALLEGIKATLKGRTIAQDVDIEHVNGMLDRLEKAPPANADESVSEEQHNAMAAAAKGESNLGIPKDVGEEFIDADKGKTFDEGGFREMLKGKGLGEDDVEEIMGKLPKSEPKGEDEADEPEKDKDPDDKPAGKDKTAKDKTMMGKDEIDKAVQAAVRAADERNRGVRIALDEVRPYVGELPATLAFDTGADVRRHALVMLGVPEAKTLHADALSAVLRVQQKAGARPPAGLSMATDSAGTKSFAEMFPTADRIGFE